MREPVIRGFGLAASLAYAALVAWLYATQPQTVAQVTGGFASIVGGYTVDSQGFADGLRFFLYSDAALFGQGLAAVDKAIALAPGGRLVVDDPDLQMHSADELRAELQRGVTRELSDLNPLRVLRTRK